jgi:hypothetical protein
MLKATAPSAPSKSISSQITVSGGLASDLAPTHLHVVMFPPFSLMEMAPLLESKVQQQLAPLTESNKW